MAWPPTVSWTPAALEAEEPVPLELPPARGGAGVVMSNVAFAKYTRQSSVRAAPAASWMLPTEPEREPWWEIDLGANFYIDHLRLELELELADAELVVEAFAYASPAGGVPRGAWTHRAPAARKTEIAVRAVARYLRVGLVGDEEVVLSLRSVAVMAAELFGPSLLATYQRAFTFFAERPLFAMATDGFATWVSYRAVWERACALARGLASRVSGGAGERPLLAICAANAPEWVITDLAAIQLGWVVVPLSPDDADERLEEIARRCGLHVVVCGDTVRWRSIASRCESIELIIATRELADFEVEADDDVALRGREESDALYSLLFTSGSTGAPKGAMRSYDSFNSMLRSYGVVQPPVHLSFQPLSHLSERMLLPTVMVNGGRVGFSRGGAYLLEDLARLEPTFLFSVPRLYEVLFERYRRRVRELRAAQPDAFVEPQALSEMRGVFGDRLTSIAVGSAPCSPEVLDFLQACFADIWVTEGYGSTECGTITVNGRIAEGVDVRLEPVPELGYDPEGEPPRGAILVKTPYVISGYYGDETSSRERLDADGYFRTGDLGERGADGVVHVIGRLSSAVKLAQGEFVSPDRVEVELTGCALVDQIYVHVSEGSLAAVVLPRPRTATSTEVLAALRRQADKAQLSSYEIPTRVLLLSEPMSRDNGLLTVSGKLRRRVAAERFGPLLRAQDRALEDVPETGLLGRVMAVTQRALGREVHADAPLDEAVLDSLSAAELMSALGGELGKELPLAWWFGAATLRDLAQRIEQEGRGGATSGAVLHAEDLELVPVISVGEAATTPPRRVLLTGGTGFLGAHLLEAILEQTAARVTCLVRAEDSGEGRERLDEVLAALDVAVERERVDVLAGDLATPRLGLDEATWSGLDTGVDAIFHAGALVSWLARYEDVRGANVHGTCTLLELAGGRRHKPLHFVSTISCAPPDGGEGESLAYPTVSRASPYAVSKWIAERHVARAHARGLAVSIYRPAMIAGHSQRGHGNSGDFINRYLASCLRIGRHLDLDEKLDMTPVDYVAKGIVALALRGARGETHHLANISGSMSYAELGEAMRAAGASCAPASYAEFRAAALEGEQSPLRALASYLPPEGFALRMGPWPDHRTREVLAGLGVCCPTIDDAIVARYLSRIEGGSKNG